MSDIILVDVAEPNFFSLPVEVQQLFRTYGIPMRGPDRDTMRFELAAHRWVEIQQAMPNPAIGQRHDIVHGGILSEQ